MFRAMTAPTASAKNLAVSPPRVVMALGGGAALGLAHIGVLKVLGEAGVDPAAYAGTSIGAIVGAVAIAGKLHALEEIVRGLNWRRLLAFADPQMGGPGLLKGAAIMAEFERHVGVRQIEELPKPFATIASDLIAGREVVFTQGPLTEAVRASISVPGVFLPVQRGEMLLVDGGLTNPVPVTAARRLPGDVVIAVNVTGDYAGRARAAGIELDRLLPRQLPAVPAATVADQVRALGRRLFYRSPRRPGLFSVAVTSGALIMRELAASRLARDPPDLEVVPEVGHISPADFDRADELIKAGEEAMTAALPRLKGLFAGLPTRASLGRSQGRPS